MSRRAVILAGGLGTRLRPYTVVLPKPLMPIGDYPILEVIVKQLARGGFAHVTLAVNHQAELIRAFFQDGARWRIRIDYSMEDEPLSTMAPLRLISDLPENFLVMNGDLLTDLDFAAFLDTHVAAGDLFTIASQHRLHTIDYGVLESGEGGGLTAFREKPQFSYEVSMGVYAVNRAVVERIPVGRPFGFDDLMHAMLESNTPVRVRPHAGYWLDIGRPDDYARAIEEFERMRPTFLGADGV